LAVPELLVVSANCVIPTLSWWLSLSYVEECFTKRKRPEQTKQEAKPKPQSHISDTTLSFALDPIFESATGTRFNKAFDMPPLQKFAKVKEKALDAMPLSVSPAVKRGVLPEV
jgi:hypothetical protein